MTLVAIHQPNFLPWLGFFNKLARADRFIVLDSVAMPLTGGGYTNRVQMLIGGKAMWMTVPIERGRSARERIDRAKMAPIAGWRRKMKLSIQQSYSKALHFEETMAMIDRVLGCETNSLCAMNMAGIIAIAQALNLDTAKIIRSSALACKGQSTELLANLVEAVGGNAYLTGHGAEGYQDDAVFARRKITILRQQYHPPSYPQGRVAEFVPGLSAIDALMHCGRKARDLVTE